jgi:ATP-dependent DNA helicase PIF1
MTMTGKQNWKKVKVLIIDEISMLKPDILDKLNEIAKIKKNNNKPFGGI